MIPTLTKAKPAMNLAAMTFHVRSGCVRSVSSVPSRCSSDTSRIVAAGTKSVSNIGSHRLITARIDASGAMNSCRKPRPARRAAKMTRSMYPVGWSKYPFRSFLTTAKIDPTKF